MGFTSKQFSPRHLFPRGNNLLQCPHIHRRTLDSQAFVGTSPLATWQLETCNTQSDSRVHPRNAERADLAQHGNGQYCVRLSSESLSAVRSCTRTRFPWFLGAELLNGGTRDADASNGTTKSVCTDCKNLPPTSKEAQEEPRSTGANTLILHGQGNEVICRRLHWWHTAIVHCLSQEDGGDCPWWPRSKCCTKVVKS